MKAVASVCCLLLSAVMGLGTETFVFEFGSDDGDAIYAKDGSIGFLNTLTTVDILVPAGTSVTYVKVTVSSFSSPKVDYDSTYQKIHIKFTYTQISNSNYNVLVKGKKIT